MKNQNLVVFEVKSKGDLYSLLAKFPDSRSELVSILLSSQVSCLILVTKISSDEVKDLIQKSGLQVCFRIFSNHQETLLNSFLSLSAPLLDGSLGVFETDSILNLFSTAVDLIESGATLIDLRVQKGTHLSGTLYATGNLPKSNLSGEGIWTVISNPNQLVQSLFNSQSD